MDMRGKRSADHEGWPMKTAGALLLVLGLVSPGLGQDAKPEEKFHKALSTGNLKELEEACRDLVGIGTPPMAKVILGSLATPKVDAELYWVMIRACAAFSTTDGLHEVAAHVIQNKGRPVSRDLAMALHNNFSAPVEAAMVLILREGNEELRLLALDHLADIGRKDAIGTILDIMKREGSNPASTEVRRRMILVLTGLTGQDFGDSLSNWMGWWEANRDKPWEQIRKGESGGTDLGFTRTSDLEKVKEQKVLLLHAGNNCRCKRNHDLDRNLAPAVTGLNIVLDSVCKDEWEKDDGKLDSGASFKASDYIAIIAMCTQIHQHCTCPKCKPGGASANRMRH